MPMFTLSTIAYNVLLYAPAERATHSTPISTLPLYVLCGYKHPTPLKGEEGRKTTAFVFLSSISLHQFVALGRSRIG
jgi:hypothetical protein